MENRFLSHVEKTDTCWLWSPVRADGYGQTRYEGRTQNAHRVAYKLLVGPISDDLVVRHRCKHRHCVNPEHLETGTREDNEADKLRDGTRNQGEKQHLAKLTADQVRDIRSRVDQTLTDIAAEFGVSRATISMMVARKTWKHIT
jgi:hypothetical protein